MWTVDNNIYMIVDSWNLIQQCNDCRRISAITSRVGRNEQIFPNKISNRSDHQDGTLIPFSHVCPACQDHLLRFRDRKHFKAAHSHQDLRILLLLNNPD